MDNYPENYRFLEMKKRLAIVLISHSETHHLLSKKINNDKNN